MLSFVDFDIESSCRNHMKTCEVVVFGEGASCLLLCWYVELLISSVRTVGVMCRKNRYGEFFWEGHPVIWLLCFVNGWFEFVSFVG